MRGVGALLLPAATAAAFPRAIVPDGRFAGRMWRNDTTGPSGDRENTWAKPVVSSTSGQDAGKLRVCIYYATWNGRTEAVAKLLGAATELVPINIQDGGDDAPPFTGDFQDCDSIMVGTPTYNTGADDHRSTTNWDDWMYEVLPTIDISGKNVAVFCTGDQKHYGEYYCDAAGELYDNLNAAGCNMQGFTSTDGYTYTKSKAERDGQFMGGMFDQKNQADLSQDRANTWIEQLRGEGFFGTDDEGGGDTDDTTTDDANSGGSDSEELRVCIYYASWHGRTESVANLLGGDTGLTAVNIQEGGDDAPPFVGDFHDCDSIMVGTPTYNTGADDHRSETNWDDWMYEVLPTLDISGKNVAVFCTGDQNHYGEYYCDAAGELYDNFKAAGCNMQGFTSTDGYTYTKSKAERDGQFMGRMFDQKNQAELSEARAVTWVWQLRGEGFFGTDDEGGGETNDTTDDDSNGGSDSEELRVCIYYASWHGRTEAVANLLGGDTGLTAVNIQEGGDAAPPFVGDFHDCDSIMVGTPTYNTGADDHRSETNWDDWMYEVLPTLDISGKNVAVFCTGDQKHYDEYYCDAAGELYDNFKAAGCNMQGFTSTDGYTYTNSKAERDGQFMGGMFDQKNQADLSEDRASTWVEQLRGEGFFGTGDEGGGENDDTTDDTTDDDSNSGGSDLRACIYFASNSGNTETAANLLGASSGLDPVDIQASSKFEGNFDDCDSIMVGTPTYNTGAEDHRSDTNWDDWMYEVLPTLDISGKNVAVFCTGDQKHFDEYYCDAAGELYDNFKAAGCNMQGFTSTDGYTYTKSKAERDGQFMGQMFDQKTQADLSEDRADAWVEQLREEGFFGTGDSTPPNKTGKDCIYYATMNGNTEAAANLLGDATGLTAVNIQEGGDDAPPFMGDFHDCGSIVVGTPTYNTGADDHRSDTNWDDWMYEVLPTLDISGKNVAVFCTGDQKHFDEYFCDAAGELYDNFKAAGCNMFGFTSTEGYTYTQSKSERDGQFIGQMFDQKNQADLSEGRAISWVEQLEDEGFFVDLSNHGGNDDQVPPPNTDDEQPPGTDDEPLEPGDDDGSDSGNSTARGCIYFGSNSGNTEEAAGYLGAATGISAIDISDGASFDADFADCDWIMTGTPTYNTGADDHRSDTRWDDWYYDVLPSLDLSGKKVAVFCTGDQKGYDENFCDAAGEMYDNFEAAGCSMHGFTSTDGYTYIKSKAERDGQLIGQMFDRKGISEENANAWVEQLRNENFFELGSDAVARVGIFFGTLGGNTEDAAGYLSALTAVNSIDIDDDGATFTEDFHDYDSIMVGTPTYNTGADDHRSTTRWDDWYYDVLPSLDLSGKKVAVFCTGDQKGYDENFCDAAGEMYDNFKAAGCTMLGFTSTDGYSYVKSKAERGGEFIGMMFDQKSQKDLSEARAAAWVEQLKGEGFFDVGGNDKPDGDGNGDRDAEDGGLSGGGLVGVILAVIAVPILALSVYSHYQRVHDEEHGPLEEDQGTPYTQLLPTESGRII